MSFAFKSIKYGLVLCVLLLVYGMFYHGSTVRSMSIGFSNFNKIGPKLYSSPTFGDADNQSVISLVEEARVRISHHFGEPIATPTIIVFKGDDHANKFGLGGAPGMLLIAPWDNYLLLNLDKAGIDVAAHELVHAEIAQRLGYLDRMLKIPTWLDEGVALQVDYRPEYAQQFGIEQAELSRVTALEKPAQFWTSDPQQNYENYVSSKSAVNMTLFGQRTQGSLYSLLDRLNDGEELDALLGVTK